MQIFGLIVVLIACRFYVHLFVVHYINDLAGASHIKHLIITDRVWFSYLIPESFNLEYSWRKSSKNASTELGFAFPKSIATTNGLKVIKFN